jgi:hypothetical protein
MRKPAPQVELPLTRPIDLLRAALLVASAEAGERGVRVQSDLSPALPYVRVDRALMEEAATILLRAAVRGAAEGKAVAVTATLQLAEVVIEIQSASAAVVGLDETLAALLIEASGARFAREAQQQLIRCPTGAPAVP